MPRSRRLQPLLYHTYYNSRSAAMIHCATQRFSRSMPRVSEIMGK